MPPQSEPTSHDVSFRVGDDVLVGVYHPAVAQSAVDATGDHHGERDLGEHPNVEHRFEPSGSRPAVVFLHGFTSNRMEDPVFHLHEGLFERTARATAAHGYHALRFDFRGHGESDGAFSDITLTRLLEDAEAAVGFVQQLDGVDSDRIALLGHSLGTVAAACGAAKLRGVRALVLWHALPYPYQTFVDLLGVDTVRRALTAGETSFPWEDKGTFTLRSKFFEELIVRSPLVELAAFNGAMQLVFGSRDPYIQPQPWMAQAFEAAHPGHHTTIHMPVDHTFNVRTRGAKYLDEAIGSALTFLDAAFN